MKRKNYILLIAAAMLASSCANDDVIDTSAKVEMKFRVTADSPTRAADAYCNNNLPQEFTLSCTIQGQLMPLFSYENLTRKSSTAEYTFDNQNNYYWSFDPYFEYDFTATNAQKPSKLPIKSTDNYADYKENEDGYHFIKTFFNNNMVYKHHIIHTVPANASAQKDLLLAYTKKYSNQVTNGVVNLNFAHLLSKVVFYAKVTNPHLLVQIEEVKVCNVFTKGRFEMLGRELNPTYDNYEDHTGGATAPTYLDKLDMLWYANTTRTANDSQHSAKGAFTTETISPMVSVSTASGALSISDETNSAEGHTTSENIAHTLMLIPQVTNAWVPGTTYPTPTAEGQTGSYFLVKCRIWDTKTPGVWVDPSKTNGSVELWPNKTGVTTEYIAIPFAADWKLGRKYVYTFVFGNSGGFGGYNPSNGDKVLLPIKLTCSVEDFVEVPVSGDLDR